MHFLVHYASVNIPLMHGYGIHDVQERSKDNYELLPALHSFVMDYLTPCCRVPSDTLITGQLLASIYTFCGTQDVIILSQEPTTGPRFEPNEASPHPLILFLKDAF